MVFQSPSTRTRKERKSPPQTKRKGKKEEKKWLNEKKTPRNHQALKKMQPVTNARALQLFQETLTESMAVSAPTDEIKLNSRKQHRCLMNFMKKSVKRDLTSFVDKNLRALQKKYEKCAEICLKINDVNSYKTTQRKLINTGDLQRIKKL